MSDPRELITHKKLAIIIAIENYRKGITSINPVKYARNDAERFKQILIDDFGYLESEIKLLLDHDAVKSALENDIPYEIMNLTSEYQLVFYYAGHGFYKDGDNKLTCWDSHPSNLSGTCVSLDEILFTPLSKSDCKKSLIFLDCCSSELKDSFGARDVLSDLAPHEFEHFIQPDDYHAVFMSCSPGQKSHSCDILKHGIWTWHLTQALSGKEDAAIINDFFITDASLQNYLSHAVPAYITKETDIRSTQRPYAKIHAKNNFLIRKLSKDITAFDSSLPDLRLNYSKAIFRKIDSERIKDAPGFRKGHSVPKWKNATSIKFVQELFAKDVENDIQSVYDGAKKILNLRGAEIDQNASIDGGYIKCEYFRYYLDIDLDEDDLSKAKMTRQLELRVPRKRLPNNFDSIFDMYLDELIIPIIGDIKFSDVLNQFENLAEQYGGSVKDRRAKGTVEYLTDRATSITINTEENELIITHYSPLRSLALIDKSMEDLKMISSHKIKFLGE
ncbi:caspase family protein [Chitinophaga sp. 212800010-3]|uniref:caspase family protein n=1 Tax=unclassified Chitinophaga TaxID=2619133 RepID=UPI002DED4E13|nr:hypothetical protein [Chitinophaga sp. 212800010-3]